MRWTCRACEGGLELLGALSDGEAAARVAGKRVHVLVDLNGWMPGGRPGILARRPAPIQVRA
jgi:protein O-GlcNAc transferase